MHAILGCDTTSRLYGLGKGSGLKKVCNSGFFCEQATVFTEGISTYKSDIVVAGEKAVVCLYNGGEGDSIDQLRYNKFCQKVATSNKRVEAESLPPTSAATKFHSLRVFHQVQQWKGVNVDMHMNSIDWGWKVKDGHLLPILTDIPAAPRELLEIIQCSCKT